MLVLSRKCGQRIVLNNGVTVELLQIRGRLARLGVTAPPQVRILREELVGPKEARRVRA